MAANYLLSALALSAGLVLTAWATQLSWQNKTATMRANFQQVTQQAIGKLNARFTNYATLVRSGQGLFAASTDVDPVQWRAFAHSLDFMHHYPAVVAFDFIASVPDAGMSAYRRRMKELIPGFELRYVNQQSTHCIVQYEAPLRDNSPAVGGDGCAFDALRSVLQQALAARDIVTSEKVELGSRPLRNQAGFIMAVPIFRNDQGEKSADSLVGWSMAVLAINRVMADLVPPGLSDSIELFQTLDNGKQQRIQFRAVGGSAPVSCDDSRFATSCLSVREPLALPGRHWSLVFRQNGVVPVGSWVVGLAGLIISVLVAIMLFRWGRIHAQAVILADEKTRALRKSEDLLSSVTGNIFEGIYRGDPERGLLYVNKAFARMFGYPDEETMRGVPGPRLYANVERRNQLRDLLWENGYYRNEEIEYVRRDGSHFIGINNAVAVYNEAGEIEYWDGAITDITQRKTVEERAWYLARYDSLTGLANRRHFRENARAQLALAKPTDQRLALLFIDLDHFKTVNDYLGHDAGDELLNSVARRIQKFLGTTDLASRQGGDEFLVLLTDVGNENDVERVAERMLKALAGVYTLGVHDVTMTPSIGVSLFPNHGSSVEGLISNADAAMYHAKSRGRYSVQLFTPELDASRKARIGIESDLREAIHRDQLKLVYQPQVDVSSGKVIGVESLLRWIHPQRGEISPAEFIEVAEQSGLIVPIGEWVLREACRQNREWQLAGLPVVPIAVNVSAVQFLRGNLDKTVLATLEESHLDPGLLELELTETVVMQDIDLSVGVIDSLRRVGVEFAIDDFGTGYSSLHYLRWFKLKKLKIDKSFISDITSKSDDVAIIEAVIGLAGTFGLRAVAEGVETMAQLELLRERGCRFVQGYYFSRPVEADVFADILATGSLEGAEA